MKRIFPSIFAVLVFAVILNSLRQNSSQQDSSQQDSSRQASLQTKPQSQEDDIREVVFRFHMARTREKGHYYLDVGNRFKDDPSAELLERLRKYNGEVYGISRCKPVAPRGAKDKVTGKHGSIISLRPIEMKGADKAEAWADCFFANSIAIRIRCDLKRIGGKWDVVRSNWTTLSDGFALLPRQDFVPKK